MLKAERHRDNYRAWVTNRQKRQKGEKVIEIGNSDIKVSRVAVSLNGQLLETFFFGYRKSPGL